MEVHGTITKYQLFNSGERVAIGASGGKDSTVLLDVLFRLNRTHNYGLELVLLSIDEGIRGYRDDSLRTVQRNMMEYNLPLHVLSYRELYGWSMDEIVSHIGTKSNCTFCGVFRRQALDRGAIQLHVDKIATGHNLDDLAETILMNLLRGDSARLVRCTSISTNTGEKAGFTLPRVKPLKYAYEKEIVLYARHRKLDYFSTECTYAKEAFRGYVRNFLKELESVDSRSVLRIVQSGESFERKDPENRDTITESSTRTSPNIELHGQCMRKGEINVGDWRSSDIGKCERCSYMTSQRLCRACQLLDVLNKGRPQRSLQR